MEEKKAGYRCQLCGRGGNKIKLETHHITPVSKGGSNNPRNLICLCQECHRLRHPRRWTKSIREHPEELLAKIIFQPRFR